MHPSHASWRNPRILTLLVLLFLAGGLVGAWTMREFHHRVYPPPVVVLQTKAGTQLSYEQLRDDLHLSHDQAQQLKSVLDDFVKYDQDLRMQVEDFRATGKNRIRSILKPDQQREFEKLCSEVHSR